MVSLIQHFKADFLWKVSLKVLNSAIILKTFTHVICTMDHTKFIVSNQKEEIIST